MNHGLASPDLFLAFASHQLPDHVVLRGPDGHGQPITWDLHHVLVTSFRTDYVRGGNDAGQDTFTLSTLQATLDPAGAVILGAPAQSPLGTSISLTAEVNTLVSTTGLHYTWTVTQHGQPAANGPDAPTFAFTPSQTGTYIIGLSVRDAYGDAVAAASQTILVPARLSGSSSNNGSPGQKRPLLLKASDSASPPPVPVASLLAEELSTSSFEPPTDWTEFRSDPVWPPKDPSPEPHGSPKTDGHGDKGGSGHSPKRGTHPVDKLHDELFAMGDLSSEPLVSDLALALQAPI
jgi:hypothetical protein